MRRRLVEAAATLLAESGPAALTARRVAAAAGTSTMSVYSHVGSMELLVRAVVEEGFRTLEQALLAVDPTDDPVRDVAAQTAAYLRHATTHPDLYAVMFGTLPLGPYRASDLSDLKAGRRETLDRIGHNLFRAVEEGRIDQAGESDLAFTWWSAIHGYALLESSGHIRADPGRVRVLERLLTALFVGLGDDPGRAGTSVREGLAAG